MRHPHPALHLVLISRHDPPLPLSDWRARRQMMDVRSADLRFALEETADFIDKATDKNLDDETIALLQANTEGWSSRDKFAAVLETAALNETDLAEYCRKRGLYPAQITAWRSACEQANDWDRASTARLGQATKEEKKRVKDLERELARKEKALAEAAALLILRKKASAIC